MAHSSENRIDLRGDGRIILYKRTGSKDPVWQVRIRVPNSTVSATCLLDMSRIFELPCKPVSSRA